MPPKKTKKQEQEFKTANQILQESTETVTLTQQKPKAKSVKKTSAQPKKPISPPAKSQISIDHPIEGEMISGLHYAIRIGTTQNGNVEISFDNKQWSPCRFSAGYWWFDWGYFSPGSYKISARLIDENGNVLVKSTARKCKII